MTTPPLGNADALSDALEALATTIDERAGADPNVSYTAKLLEAAVTKPASKIIEEAGELAIAICAESEKEVAAEAADLLYHMYVGLRAAGVELDAVAAALRDRQGMSGLEEKASRS